MSTADGTVCQGDALVRDDRHIKLTGRAEGAHRIVRDSRTTGGCRGGTSCIWHDAFRGYSVGHSGGDVHLTPSKGIQINVISKRDHGNCLVVP